MNTPAHTEQPFIWWKDYAFQALFCMALGLFAMIISAEFLTSVSMISLMALAVFQLENKRIIIRKNLRQNFRNLFQNKAFLAATIPFFIVLFSAVYSSDFDYTLARLQIKLPFLILPFAFLSIPKISKPYVLHTIYFFILLMFVTAVGVGINYLMHFEEINDLIGRGKPIPTPSNHIRYSLALAISILGGATLVVEKYYWKFKTERWLISGITLALFAFIHIFSVRSGLLALYAAIFVISLRWMWQTRRFGLGFLALFLLASLPFLAYQYLPSFQTKIKYARWDFKQYWYKKGSNYSDSERMISLEAGIKIGNQHPILGVGAGDLKREIKALYATDFPESASARQPHNQLISLYAGTGIVGLSLFLFSFFFPLFYQKNYQNDAFLGLHIIFFCSLFMENTFENNFGISLFLMWLLLGLNYLKNRHSDLFELTAQATATAPQKSDPHK